MYMFLIHLVYLSCITGSYVMFTFGFSRRNYFPLRAILSFAAITCIVMFVPDNPFEDKVVLPISLNTICVLIGLILVTKFIYNISWKGALFYAISVPLLQHLGSHVNRLFVNLFIPDDILGPGQVAPFNCSMPRRIIFLASFTGTYLLCYFIFLWRKRDLLDPSLKSWQLIIFSLLATVIVFVLGNYANHINHGDVGPFYYIPTMICCFMLLYSLFMTNKTSRLETEEKVIKGLLEEQQKRYEAMALSMEKVNSKVHDLKYLLSSVRNSNSSESNTVIERIRTDVSEYETQVHTGSIALDNTIAERQSICAENAIRLDYSIDGNALSFMEAADIYVLFGNAMDNAIECVKHYDDTEKRSVRITSFKRGNVLKISVENYCDEARIFNGGLPQTTKSDSGEHGYGCKSMRYIAKKYGGNIVFAYEEGKKLFVVNMLFSISKND